MTDFCIVAARPKNAGNHLNSQFKLYEWNATDNKWKHRGWKSIGEISQLMQSGHDVLTGKIVGDIIKTGAMVEIELRIAKNDTYYRISDMPDA